MAKPKDSAFLKVLSGEILSPPPLWMMRQAGRHLPEYMELRGRARDFLDFCYTPSLATEATLQPVRRYDMDAAILFADILLILDAMGLDVRFEKGVGPIVQKVASVADFSRTDVQVVKDRLSPVYETVSRVRSALADNKALIGFAGAPWTVALYAIEGRGGTDKSESRVFAYQRRADMKALLDLIVECSAHYLLGQVEAGVDAIMLFESWAEGLPPDLFQWLVIEPNRALVSRLRELGADVPIIGFPRGAGSMLPAYAAQVGVNGVGLDTAVAAEFVNAQLDPKMPVQGQLDPLLLLAGGDAMDRRVREIVKSYENRPHIFNLGHGVLPTTPIAHVKRVIEILRGG